MQPHGLKPTRLLYLWNSPGKNTGVRCHSLLQGIFLTQGSNPGLLHCRQIPYHLSHQGSLWGRMETYICMAESLCCSPETITVLLIGYIPIQNRRRQWQPTPVLLRGKSHGLRSLVGCSPWGHEESDTTERLHFHCQYKIKRLNFKKIFKETIHVE